MIRLSAAYLDQNHVEFVEIGLFLFQALPGRAGLDDQADNVLLDALALIPRQHFPPRLDDALQYLEGEILGLLIVGKFQYSVNLKNQLSDKTNWNCKVNTTVIRDSMEISSAHGLNNQKSPVNGI